MKLKKFLSALAISLASLASPAAASTNFDISLPFPTDKVYVLSRPKTATAPPLASNIAGAHALPVSLQLSTESKSGFVCDFGFNYDLEWGTYESGQSFPDSFSKINREFEVNVGKRSEKDAAKTRYGFLLNLFGADYRTDSGISGLHAFNEKMRSGIGLANDLISSDRFLIRTTLRYLYENADEGLDIFKSNYRLDGIEAKVSSKMIFKIFSGSVPTDEASRANPAIMLVLRPEVYTRFTRGGNVYNEQGTKVLLESYFNKILGGKLGILTGFSYSRTAAGNNPFLLRNGENLSRSLELLVGVSTEILNTP